MAHKSCSLRGPHTTLQEVLLLSISLQQLLTTFYNLGESVCEPWWELSESPDLSTFRKLSESHQLALTHTNVPIPRKEQCKVSGHYQNNQRPSLNAVMP